MTKIEGITVDEVNELTEKVIKAWKETGAHEAHEDFSDAFSYIGEIWNYIGARMLYMVYKNDPEGITKEHMEGMLSIASTAGEEALEGLGAFGIRRTSIDDI
jgi:flagellin-specific chaperone FliS